MQPDKIKEAETEAKRFLKTVAELHRMQNLEDWGSHPKEQGSVRRASMDLTRALAAMRRP